MPTLDTALLLDIKNDFPLLAKKGDEPLHYLDSAATTQKPAAVIDAMDKFYREEYGTVRRGVYRLSEKATAAYEGTRKKVAAFLGAASEKEIIYTGGTTDSINLVAYAYARKFLKAGDEILLKEMEHHANIVPWQLAAQETGAIIKVVPITDEGELDMEAFSRLLSPRTRIMAVTYLSNALGTINPIRRIVKDAHAVGAVVLVDGAQSTPHMQVNLRDLDADFYAFSGHKIFGPTGIGIPYGKMALLEQMPPFKGGGDMIIRVTFEKTTYQQPPHRFEAGTPPIAEVVGLGAALDYVQSIGIDNIARHEKALLDYGTEALKAVPGLRLIGTARNKASVLAFHMEDIHPHDIGTMLDQEGIAIRAGHHCAQPVMDHFGVPATARASLGPYNAPEDLDALVKGLLHIREVFA